MDLIAIGRISKPIGTRGEVKISLLTHDKKRFMNLSTVWVGHDAADVELKKILKARIDTKHAVLNFDGIETVEEAERIRNLYLFVPKEDAVKLQNGSYFIDDVIGCEVVTEEQTTVGVITDLLSLPMNDLWVVKKEAKEILIPAVKAIIRQVDVENKRITIHALDGLLD
ncbi:MAG: ribosome maturation factor RimM [Bacteroidota bacterium]|jgi:16S rRNA processing protein RimM